MTAHWHQLGILAIVALAAFLAGCQSEPVRPAPLAVTRSADAPNLDAALAEARTLQRPLIVLIAETGLDDVNNAAIALLKDAAVKSRSDKATPLILDLAVSRNRATAARFHIIETPILVCLSPSGVIASRDEKPIGRELLLKRIDEAVQTSPELDAKLASLDEAMSKNGDDATATLNLADFLLARQNAREAIPRFVAVAHSATVEPGIRTRAWVALARAHLWIAEPEKGRHEAKDLIATLGPKVPEALAGGTLVLGLQDAKGKRFALARHEFEDAIAAAPDSIYAMQAADEIAKLPTPGK